MAKKLAIDVNPERFLAADRRPTAPRLANERMICRQRSCRQTREESQCRQARQSSGMNHVKQPIGKVGFRCHEEATFALSEVDCECKGRLVEFPVVERHAEHRKFVMSPNGANECEPIERHAAQSPNRLCFQRNRAIKSEAQSIHEIPGASAAGNAADIDGTQEYFG